MASCVNITKVQSIQSRINDDFTRYGFAVIYTTKKACVVFTLLDDVGDIICSTRVCKTAIRFDNTHTLALMAIEKLKEKCPY